METSASGTPPNVQSLVDAVIAHMTAGRCQQALDLCLELARSHPKVTGLWMNAAINCLKLKRWQEAIDHARSALACGENTFAPYDILAQAHGHLKQWDAVRRCGLQALNMRDRQFGGAPVMPPPAPAALPPLPSAQTRERNLIAFSLFGGDSRYCESAVLNVQEQPRIYPDWVCRFYVDGSVPESVIARLRAGGAQIVQVEGAAAQWPGPMWRFLALDDPQAHHILFRDADSVISRREAGAVARWLASGKRFHILRDWCSHTELIQAGLWDVVGGSLPPLEQLMERFLSAPIESQHYADQYFLRQYVWPYARTSMMQHDSVFGFMGGIPFPDGPRPDHEGFNVGCSEGEGSFALKLGGRDGVKLIWTLYLIDKHDDGQTREERVCSYPGTVKDGTLKAYIPTRYARRMKQGTARIGLRAGDAA